MLKSAFFQATSSCWFTSKYCSLPSLSSKYCSLPFLSNIVFWYQTYMGREVHVIYKSSNAFPITLLCIAVATKRWNQPRWKHFQGWSLMAKIIAETYTSPKQTTSRLSNVWSILSPATSHQHRLPCEQNTPNIGQDILITADLCGWASSTLLQANHRVGPELKRQRCCSSDLSEIHLQKVTRVIPK